MSTKIRRNKDGQQNLVDLRKAVECRTDVSVHSQGGQWIVMRASHAADCWLQSRTPYWCDERAALQLALFGEMENKDEASYHASKDGLDLHDSKASEPVSYTDLEDLAKTWSRKDSAKRAARRYGIRRPELIDLLKDGTCWAVIDTEHSSPGSPSYVKV